MSSPIGSILVPLDGSARAANTLGCAAWLAQRLDARMHILSATNRKCPAREELARLKVPEHLWPLIMLHQSGSYPEEAILRAVDDYSVDLVVLAVRGESSERTPADSADPLGSLAGHVAQAILEASPVPVLLMPVGYVERLPWERMLVPISGEAEADTALALAVKLANALGLTIEVAHVIDGHRDRDIDLSAAGGYADAAHHEYPGRLEALVRRAVPQYSAEECGCIDEITLRHGEIGGELLELIEDMRSDVFVVGWHGCFATGHAQLLKRILQVATCPVLLVQSPEPQPFRLKVGESLE